MLLRMYSRNSRPMEPPASGNHRKLPTHRGPVVLRERKTPEFSVESRVFQALPFKHPSSALERDRAVLEARKGSVGYEKRDPPKEEKKSVRFETPSPPPPPAPRVVRPQPRPIITVQKEESPQSSGWQTYAVVAILVAGVVLCVWAYRKKLFSRGEQSSGVVRGGFLSPVGPATVKAGPPRPAPPVRAPPQPRIPMTL